MAEKTSQGLNLYDYMTDRNRDIYDGTFGKTDGTNPSSMEVINNFMENKLTLNGEKSKQNFNFIANEVVKDGLVELSTPIDTNYDFYMLYKFKALKEKPASILFAKNCGVNVGSTSNIRFYYDNGTTNVYAITQVPFIVNNEYVIEFYKINNVLHLKIDGVVYSLKLEGYVSGSQTISTGSGFVQSIYLLSYKRILTPQEIQHNFTVLNNSPSTNQLQVTNQANQTSISFGLGANANHVEMSSGRTLEEEYMGVLEGMSQEYTSTGASITVNDGIKARLTGAEIQGQTVKNIHEFKQNIDVTISSSDTNCSPVKKIDTNVNTKYTMIFYVSEITGSPSLDLRTYQGVYSCSNLQIGINAFSFTTASTNLSTNQSYIRIDGGVDKGNKLKLAWFNLLEGDVSKYQCNSFLPFGLSSTQATLSNNGVKYSFYASEEDKKNQKLICLNKVGDVADSFKVNNDGSGVLNKEYALFRLMPNMVTSIAWESSSTNTRTFELKDNIPLIFNNQSSTSTQLPYILCNVAKEDTFKNLWGNGVSVDRKQSITTYYLSGKSFIVLVIDNNNLSELSIEGCRKYLSDNDVWVTCRLTTPTMTTIPKEVNPPVSTVSGTNVVLVESPVGASSLTIQAPTKSQIKKQYVQTLLNNYTGTANANLLKDGRGQLDINVTIPSTFNQTIFSLATELRPKSTRKIMGFNGNTPVTVTVNTDGTVKIPTTITGTLELCDSYII